MGEEDKRYILASSIEEAKINKSIQNTVHSVLKGGNRIRSYEEESPIIGREFVRFFSSAWRREVKGEAKSLAGW